MSSHLQLRTWTTVFVLALYCAACDQESKSPQQLVPEIPVVEVRDSIILERPHDCKDPVHDCSEVDIRIQVFSSRSGSLDIVLNRKIREFFVDALGGTSQTLTNPADSTVPMPSIIDAARLLFGDLQEFKEKFPEAADVWTVHGFSKVLTNDSLVCIELYVDSFTGGAHGNTTMNFVLADKKTGKTLEVKSLIKNVKMFTDSAEKVFRRQTGIGPTEELSSHNYFIEGGTFTLPENMGLTADSVILYYNTYEIAPYVVGPTRIALPRSALRQ